MARKFSFVRPERCSEHVICDEPCEGKLARMTIAGFGERPFDELGVVERCLAYFFKGQQTEPPCALLTTWISEDFENT